jgi:phosphoribosylanthranilate isomerase
MTAVKICGLSHVDHALAAATAGADMIGLVFANSPRRVSSDLAATITAALRQHPVGARVDVVGLFVNEHPTHINAIIEHCNLDCVQLSGDETLAQAAGIRRPIIKSLRLSRKATDDEAEWLTFVQTDRTSNQHIELAACPLIIDAHVPGSYGGTGTLADWKRAATLAQRQPLMLAGGLTPDNVAAAIAKVHPWGVDVSSGVERDGYKDSSLIEAFIRNARMAQ